MFKNLGLSLLIISSLGGFLTPVAQAARSNEIADSRDSGGRLLPTEINAFLNSTEGATELYRLTESIETFNKVTLLHLGRNSKPMRVKLIDESQSFIFQTVPYWFDDEEGHFFHDYLEKKKVVNPNLDLRIILDWTSPGSTGDFWGAKMYKKLTEITGGQIIQWDQPWWLREFSLDILRNRMHDKMMIFDGKKMIMGGMNVADEYLQGGLTRKGWHDTDLLIEGPAVQYATKLFIKIWELSKYLASPAPFPPWIKQEIETFRAYFKNDQSHFTFKTLKTASERQHTRPGDPDPFHNTVHVDIPIDKYLNDPKFFPPMADDPSRQSGVRLIYDNPLIDRDPETGKQYSKTINTLSYLMSQSKASIKVFIPYLTPYDELLTALKKAAREGKTVALITNSMKSHDLGKVPYNAAVSHYQELLEAGVHIYEWQGHVDLFNLEKANNCVIPDGQWPGRTVHTKAVVIDDSVAMIGSNNMNVRSQSFNAEIMALVNDREFAHDLAAVFMHDLDLEKKRTIQCGDKMIERPRQVEFMTGEKTREYIKAHKAEVDLLSQLQLYM